MTRSKSGSFWDAFSGFYDLFVAVWFGRSFRAMQRWARAQVTEPGRILEIGAGTGKLTMVLAPLARSYLATDFSAGMLRMLGAKMGRLGLKVESRILDAEAPWAVEEPMDVVVASNVLHLLDRPGEALQRMHAALRPGGLLLTPTFCHAEGRLARVLSSFARWFGFPASKGFTVASLEELVRQAGFESVRIEVVPGLMPLCLLRARRP